MSGGVFISYRREDSGGFAGRIYDRLVTRLGNDNVFFDVDAIPPGRDFVDVLSDRVGRCDALVAIIGRQWVSSVDGSNRRRLDDPNDFVRIEIEAALSRDVPVIPVLVDGAPPPQAADLPDSLKKLARRQAIEISHNRFDSDAERLTEALAKIEEAQRGPSPSMVSAAPMPAGATSSAQPAPAGGARWLVPAAVVVLAAVGGVGFFYELRGAHVEQARQAERPRTTSDVLNALEPPPAPNQALNAAPPGKLLNAAPSKLLNADYGAPSKLLNAAASPPPTAAAEPLQWLSREDFQAEVKRQFAAGNYPDKAWGRCEYGSAQAGAHWSPRPPGQRFSFYALDEQAFAAKNEELAAKGYTLQYDHTFQECDGATRHQALWMKGGERLAQLLLPCAGKGGLRGPADQGWHEKPPLERH